MNDFIREFFGDDRLGINQFPDPTSESAKLTRKQGHIYEQLENCLEPSDKELLDEYAETNAQLSKEEQLRAFQCGMKCSAEFFIGIFSD